MDNKYFIYICNKRHKNGYYNVGQKKPKCIDLDNIKGLKFVGIKILNHAFFFKNKKHHNQHSKRNGYN